MPVSNMNHTFVSMCGEGAASQCKQPERAAGLNASW